MTAAHTWRILTKTCPHSFPLCLRRAVVGPTQRNESDSFPKPKQWIHMSTAPARRIRFLLCILHCTVDSQKTDCGSSFSGKYGKDKKGGQTDQLATENTKLIRRRKNIGWEKK